MQNIKKKAFINLFLMAFLFDHFEKISFEHMNVIFWSIFFSIIMIFRIFDYEDKYEKHSFILYFTGFSFLYWSWFPAAANHSNLYYFCLVYLFFEKVIRKKDFNGNFLLASLAIVYFIAGFHKLNWDYLSVEHSCVKYILGRFDKFLPDTVQIPDSIYIIGIYSSLFIELLAPIGLFFRKTRTISLVTLFTLHFTLNLFGFVDFSMIAITTYYLFLSDETQNKVCEALYRDNSKLFKRLLLLVFSYGVLSIVLDDVLKLWRYQIKPVQGIYLNIIIAVLIFKYAKTIKFRSDLIIKTEKWHLIPLGLLIMHGMQNYLGLGTTGTFSMFSNLLTEAPYSNHLIMKNKPLKIFSLQDELVEVVKSNQAIESYCPKLSPMESFIIPKYEFIRCLQKAKKYYNGPPIAMKFNINRSAKSYNDILNSNFLDQRKWYHKPFKFRKLDKGRQYCSW